MAEPLPPRETESAEKPAAKSRPVLSRYARRAEPAGEETSAAPADTVDASAAKESAEASGDGRVEFSPPTPDLPPPPHLEATAADAAEPTRPETLPSVEPSTTSGPDGAEKTPLAGPALEAADAASKDPAADTGSRSDVSDPADLTGPAAAATSADVSSAPVRVAPSEPPRDTAPAGASGPTSPPTDEAPNAAATASETVRRVEASEVHEAGAEPTRWSGSILPVRGPASGDRQAGLGGKLPFWKRIARPLTQAVPSGAGDAKPGRPAPSLEPLLARLDALEKQLAANQSATEGQLTRFEENITRLWELEEQMTLTEVRERLALLEANQVEIADGLHTVGRNLTLLAVVLAAALMAGLLALGLLI